MSFDLLAAFGGPASARHSPNDPSQKHTNPERRPAGPAPVAPFGNDDDASDDGRWGSLEGVPTAIGTAASPAPSGHEIFLDDGDEEDFGDFEDASSTAGRPTSARAVPSSPTKPSSIYAVQGGMGVSDTFRSATTDSRDDSATTTFATETRKRRPASTSAAAGAAECESQPARRHENWEDGRGYPVFITTRWASIPDPGPDALPPTNIPPPALLLTLFPPIFASAQTSLFGPLARARPQIFASCSVVQFLQGYLAVGGVAARIIAGRKLRWRRDMSLAQGMSIGPAGRAGGGGMKLRSIDRAEAGKEDREAADVARAWGEQVGRLRSAVARADAGRGLLGAVPEIDAGTTAVRTADMAEGAIGSARPCALCGLRREERVGNVDIGVEDSFGEWWQEQLSMHRACRNFWEEQKDVLARR